MFAIPSPSGLVRCTFRARTTVAVQKKPLPGVRDPGLKHFARPTSARYKKAVELRRVHRPKHIGGDLR